MSYADHLAGLDSKALVTLLDQRPDVLVEPAPRSFEELELRLNGVDSLTLALQSMNADELSVARMIVLTGMAEPEMLAASLLSDAATIVEVLDGLFARGLAWRVGERIRFPDLLDELFARGVAPFRPLRAILKQAYADDVRTLLGSLGGNPAGLTKPAAVEEVIRRFASADRIVAAYDQLPVPARLHLDRLREPGGIVFGSPAGVQEGVLVRAGLLVRGLYGRVELPREVAVVFAAGDSRRVSGRPRLPAATEALDEGRAAAEAAVGMVTALLDEAARRPLAALKRGGVGSRERTRLGKQAGVTLPALAIDAAYATGLLAEGADGYVPSPDFPGWRAGAPGRRWAGLVQAWFDLDFAPTSRETDDGEAPPPVHMESGAGLVRRAVLRAAAGGRSLRAVVATVGWFCPMNGYDDEGLARKVRAVRDEATALGVLSGDRLTQLGELLVELEDRPDELAARASELLAATEGMVVFQSDLSAVVSGQVSVAAHRLLTATAVLEANDVAATWRFTPASMRAAFDTGYTADELRAAFVEVSGRPLPQPLDYLISDVQRRHGAVRVRTVKCCVTGAEGDIGEIEHTRSLKPLALRRIAPTVLVTSTEAGKVLAALRAAGFAPMPENEDGVVVLQRRQVTEAPQELRVAARPRITAADLVDRLAGEVDVPAPASLGRLTELARHLDLAQVTLLADALDNGRDVRIVYRNSAHNRSERVIRPLQLRGRWLTSWCHTRKAERDFTLTGIESVGPVG
ncbi:helicase-associated domain-containing protein [Pseudonocardia sp. TRM90224]|uniref:helicase-associated domain-containing protein n=1 Tax=Pseudonocardia sp. TRM90224 TaxID=2812678 RepID=UPI001E399270|nr:helicase-associated domain-containing protein [Pseudonocardia sp. TRM90224]